MTIVRKFQLPQNTQLPSTPAPQGQPGTDFDIPEINTHFIDNLFQDPAFLDRFDASYQQTALMGIAAQEPDHSTETAEIQNLLEIEFPTQPKN